MSGHTTWPVAGLPEALHVDNGADFTSKAFVRVCRNEGVDIIWRPTGKPRYGGHIERLIGTMLDQMHLLPGTSFENPIERESYDSRNKSAMSLRELFGCLRYDWSRANQNLRQISCWFPPAR